MRKYGTIYRQLAHGVPQTTGAMMGEDIKPRRFDGFD